MRAEVEDRVRPEHLLQVRVIRSKACIASAYVSVLRHKEVHPENSLNTLHGALIRNKRGGPLIEP